MGYATAEQLATWLGGESAVPSDADRMLERASELVDTAIRFAVFDVDDDGQPTDDDVIQALADATCAQVEWWIETGDELDAAAKLSSVSIGSASMVAFGPGRQVSWRLALRARDALARAGLTARVAVR